MEPVTTVLVPLALAAARTPVATSVPTRPSTVETAWIANLSVAMLVAP